MATYTSNYNLTKPTMAESADIRVINGNMDTVDEIMHSTQVSMADAFDSTATYAIRDVVMYEFELYQCIHPHTGAWDANDFVRVNAAEVGGNYVEITPTYNTGLKVADTNIDGDQDEIKVPYMTGATAQADGAGGLVPAPTMQDVGKYLKSDGHWDTPSGGGGGTTVVPNPVGTPTDTLDTIQIGQTIYDIEGSGGSGGGYSSTKIWDYVDDNNGVIPYSGTMTLNDDINNYDDIVFEFVSSAGDLSTQYWRTAQEVISVEALNNAYNSNITTFTTFGERSTSFRIEDDEVEYLISNQSNTNGLVRVWGIKYGGLYTEDIAKGEWTRLVSQAGGVWSSVADLTGYDYAIVLCNYLNSAIEPTIYKKDVLDKMLAETSTGAVRAGYHWSTPAISSYDDWEMEYTSSGMKVRVGYNLCNIEIYGVKTAKIDLGGHIYDDNEKIVGEWFGETLYEKSFNISSNEGYIDVSNLNIDKFMLNYEATYMKSSGGYTVVPYFASGNDRFYVYYNHTTNCFHWLALQDGNTNLTGVITIKYTKATS